MLKLLYRFLSRKITRYERFYIHENYIYRSNNFFKNYPELYSPIIDR